MRQFAVKGLTVKNCSTTGAMVSQMMAGEHTVVLRYQVFSTVTHAISLSPCTGVVSSSPSHDSTSSS